MSVVASSRETNEQGGQNHRCWLIVAPEDTVRRLEAEGVCQASNGNEALLSGMQAGDWVVYYAGRGSATAEEPLHSFVALGRVAEGEPRRRQLADGREVLRRPVEYCEGAANADILPLLTMLTLTAGSSKRWGSVLSPSFMEISCTDMAVIARAMGLEDEAAHICGAFAY